MISKRNKLMILLKIVLFIFVCFALCYFLTLIEFDSHRLISLALIFFSFPIYYKFNIMIYGLQDIEISEKDKSVYWYSVVACGNIYGVVIYSVCKELGIIDSLSSAVFPRILMLSVLILYNSFFPLFVKIASKGDMKCF